MDAKRGVAILVESIVITEYVIARALWFLPEAISPQQEAALREVLAVTYY